MSFVRKSRWRSFNQKRAKKRANQRAAKERKRLARLAEVVPFPPAIAEGGPCPPPLAFRVTITCLADGERVTFTTSSGPHGWSVPPGLAGGKVASVLRHYRPA